MCIYVCIVLNIAMKIFMTVKMEKKPIIIIVK